MNRVPGAPPEGEIATPLAHAPVDQLNALTSLRFLAALSVVAYHYLALVGPLPPPLSLGYTGVTFFFILSGFILTHNYSAVDFGSRSAMTNYVVSRIARIYPVFLFSLAVDLPFFVVQAAGLSPPWYEELFASSAVLAPLGLHAWIPGAACALNCPSWSISVEFFFYALFPFVLPAIMRAKGQALTVIALLWLAISALDLELWRYVGHGQSLIDPGAGQLDAVVGAQLVKFSPVARLPEFLLGIAACCLWGRCRTPALVAPLLLVAAAAAAGILLLARLIPEVMIHNGLTALAWLPLILAAAGMRRGWLLAPTMIFLGRISYSLYLLHMPVLSVVAALDKRLLDKALLLHRPSLLVAVAFALALAVSAGVFLLIEEPARRYITRRYRVGATRPAALLAASPKPAPL